MLNVLLWLVAVEAIGLAVFPLSYFLLPSLRDRGYAISKPLGILLVGYISWILSVLHVLPSVQLTVAAILVVVGGLSWTFMWPRRRQLLDFIVRERTVLAASEIVFLVVFAGWVVYRAYDPAISDTEAPMDFMYLNASIASDLGTPEDPWLRGDTVSYYYLGYWMMGALTKLTGITSNISYNLAMSLVPALGATAIFGLVSSMVSADSPRLRHAIVGGVAAAIVLVATANLEGGLEFAKANGMGSSRFWDWVGIEQLDDTVPLSESWRPEQHWWWWRASRVISSYDGDELIDQPIAEFPFFSFMLGDLHPHVMSVPFVLLLLAVLFNFYRSPLPPWRGFDPRSVGTVLLLALALGGLGFTNMWDLPVFSAMLLGIVALKTYATSGGSLLAVVRVGLLYWSIVFGLALLLILPYLLTFTSQVTGISPVAIATTRPLHLLIIWALFLAAVAPFVLIVFCGPTLRQDWARLSATAVLVGFAPYVVWAFLFLEEGGSSEELVGRLFHVMPLALLVGVAVYSAIWSATEPGSATGRTFGLALAALGLLLIMGPELLFVDDSFGGRWDRMNTVFKLYYQGWIVLAAVSGFAIYFWGELRERAMGFRRAMVHLWSAVFLVLLLGSAYYPPAAAASKGDLFHEGATLDGLAFVGPKGAEYRAIQYLRDNASRDSAILEAVGDERVSGVDLNGNGNTLDGPDYTEFGRISASTGIPTVLGWPGHELQWRGSSEPFEGRAQDVLTIYRTTSVEEAQNLLAKYSVDYVYVGSRERREHGPEGLGKFSSFMDTVFQQDAVTVYRMPP